MIVGSNAGVRRARLRFLAIAVAWISTVIAVPAIAQDGSHTAIELGLHSAGLRGVGGSNPASDDTRVTYSMAVSAGVVLRLREGAP